MANLRRKIGSRSRGEATDIDYNPGRGEGGACARCGMTESIGYFVLRFGGKKVCRACQTEAEKAAVEMLKVLMGVKSA